jgi:hypothetical protein
MAKTKVIYIPNKAGLDYVLKQEYGVLGKWMKAGARKVIVAAQRQVGKDTGALAASIQILEHSRSVTGQKILVGSRLSYALAHHEGTRPHRITGRRGGMLRFTARGRVVYTRSVMHPGTRPNKYLADNLTLVYTTTASRGIFV